MKHSDPSEVDPQTNSDYDDIENDNIDESDNGQYDEIEIPKDNNIVEDDIDLFPHSIQPEESEDFQGNSEYDEIEISEDITNDDDEDDDQDDFENSNYVEDEDNDDLYALFSIPSFGVICAIFLVIWKKYRDRFILGVLNRIINRLTNDDDDQFSPNTTSTSVDTTLVKTRMTDPILSSSSSSFPMSSITTPTGSEIWSDRIYTNAQRIFKDVKKDRSSDNLSDSLYVDVQTQVSFESSSDYNQNLNFELSILSDLNEMDSTDKSIAETSFIETRSGGRYDKVFLKK